ncbi:unnamed protein product [Prorocentrum cordatum]|uniref:Cryptochrome/DNA photolyase FAD-binding domain-containing protein n=1 Tax=Prorocentrum cordatum TaxID=2364126 RepID=A0ABN9TDI0_9DINO|nr:unnamed protein product [Polarella glacialis]
MDAQGLVPIRELRADLRKPRLVQRLLLPASEGAALSCMRDYVQRQGGLRAYEQHRSRADLDPNPNSKLSAFLRWGQLSANDLFWAVQDAGLPREQTKTFGRRLFWRDLAYFQMHHFPEMHRKGIRAHYDRARWRERGDGMLRLWQRGETGYPLVDAAMRELRATGWVQQNVRMVAATFLTEYLNISWVEGAKWYEDQLVDADVAINSMMWQNAGRSGTDQWNFLISPVSAKTQDPTGFYVRRWLPELAHLPVRFLHTPWDAPPDVLASSGVHLGTSYPERCVVDLAAARDEAKQATLEMRRSIADTWMNDGQGYDVIALPGGATTKLFTKLEYRLAKDGRQLNPSAGASKPGKGGGRGGGKGSGRAGAEPAGKGGGKRQAEGRRAAAAAGGQLTIPLRARGQAVPLGAAAGARLRGAHRRRRAVPGRLTARGLARARAWWTPSAPVLPFGADWLGFGSTPSCDWGSPGISARMSVASPSAAGRVRAGDAQLLPRRRPRRFRLQVSLLLGRGAIPFSHSRRPRG